MPNSALEDRLLHDGMLARIRSDLAALRGFCEVDDTTAPAPASQPTLTDPLAGVFENPGIEVTERLFRELVRCEAEAVVRIVASLEGRTAWTGFCASYGARHRKSPTPEAAGIVILARRLVAGRASLDAMAAALGSLQPPVLRRHRSAFLRFAHEQVTPLPAEASTALARAATIRVQLLQAYVPLVFWVARRYPYGLHGLALRRAGVAGLIDAVDGFEPERGHRFMTYARWWILARISRIGGMTRPVHRSGHQGEQLMRLGRAREGHWREHGRGPSWDDLMTAVSGASGETSWARAVLSARRFDHLSQAAHTEGGCLLDHLVDPDPPDPERDAQLADLWRLYLAVEPHLKKHRALTLRARFGLDGKPPRTLSEIGQSVGLSRERIRQMERGALAELAQRWHAERD